MLLTSPAPAQPAVTAVQPRLVLPTPPGVDEATAVAQQSIAVRDALREQRRAAEEQARNAKSAAEKRQIMEDVFKSQKELIKQHQELSARLKTLEKQKTGQR